MNLFEIVIGHLFLSRLKIMGFLRVSFVTFL